MLALLGEDAPEKMVTSPYDNFLHPTSYRGAADCRT
jgi:hypothetical protein